MLLAELKFVKVCTFDFFQSSEAVSSPGLNLWEDRDFTHTNQHSSIARALMGKPDQLSSMGPSTPIRKANWCT